MTVIVLSPGRGRDPMMKHSPQQQRAESTDKEPEGSSRWTPVRGGQPTSGEVGLPLEYVQFARSGHAADERTISGVTGDFIGGRAGAPSTEKALPEPDQAMIDIGGHRCASFCTEPVRAALLGHVTSKVF